METQTTPKTRVEAKAAGASRYFTGKPCSKGHIAERSLTGTCVECGKIAHAAWSKRNPMNAATRSAAYRERNPERWRASSLRSKRKAMGIPPAPYPCPICCELCERKLQPGKTHLDHDHVTKQFRGWLCNQCNMGLGLLGDREEGIMLALSYLLRVKRFDTPASAVL